MIDLKTASYKGVEFLFDEAETVGGNRNVGFTFPGSDSQSVERQGRVPRSFKFVIIIPHDDYYTIRNNLIRVFEDGKKGTLVHPTFGAVDNVVSGQYTLTEKISELGRGIIEVDLTVDDAPGIPTESEATASQVQQAGELVTAQAASDLANTFEVSNLYPANFSDALAISESITEAFAEAGNVATATAEKIAEYQAEIDSFAGQIGDLIRGPADLSASISGLFESSANLYDTAEATFGAMRALLSYGDLDPVIQTNTVGRIERKRNRDAMRSNMRLQAMAYAYEFAAQVQYTTEADLAVAIDELEAAYVDLRENQVISDEVLELLDRQRVLFNNVIESAAISPRSTVTIETARIPLSVLLYQYYGHTDYLDEIADLNNIKQNAFVEGQVEIFAE